MFRRLGCALTSVGFSTLNRQRFDQRCLFIKKFPRKLFNPIEAPRCFSSARPDLEPVDLFDNVDYDAITGGDENLTKKLKLIMLEMDVMRQEGHRVPSAMSTEKWKELLALPTRSQRAKQLGFWFMNEIKRANDKARKLRKKEEKAALRQAQEPTSPGHIQYGFNGSTIFLRIYDTTIDRWRNSRLIEAMMFGQPIVIDCSYENYMNLKEASNSALQLSYVFAENRSHQSPYNLHFCNTDPKGKMMSKFHKMIPTLYNDDFPVNLTEKSYLDVFPKEKLVYLTPHCREELLTYNHDDIYIIGAMVDKVNCEPLSLAKAKAEGLRMAKLPLDRYLDWSIGTKSLTINQVMCILLDMKISNNWEIAFRHVPRRKLKEEPHQKMRKKLVNIRKLYS